MMRKIFTLLLLTLTTLHAAPGDITVRLATQSQLLPIYVSPWTATRRHETLTTSHLRELHQILQFDLNYNGQTQIASDTPERKSQAANERTGGHPDASKWRQLGVAYLVHGHVTGETLSVKVYSIARNSEIGVYQVPLSGTLSTDRRRIHQLSDTIHQAAFHKPSIAKSRILYTVGQPAGLDKKPQAEVWISDYDGGNAHPVTAEHDFCVTPQFLPASTGKASGAFLYVCYKTGQPKIYLSPLQAPQAAPLPSLRGNQLMPTISPDKSQVAFISDAAGRPDLFLVPFSAEAGARAKPRQIFTAPASAQASPAFSPDGKKIAFVSNKDGRPRIYVLEVPTEGEKPGYAQLLTRRNRENTAPTWSPDGKKIAYSAMTEGIRQIWIYDFETDQEWQLTHGNSNKENPSWAPNSLHLAFNSVSSSGCELYMVNLNQPRAVRISSGPGEKKFPAWER